MSTAGVFNTPGGYMQLCMLAFRTSDRTSVKISTSGSQSPDPNAFLVSSLIKSILFQNVQYRYVAS